MEQWTEQMDMLLEKPCFVIDFLPERVERTAEGQFFAVEYYLLNSHRYHGLKEKFVNVIFKLMCYYHVLILWNGWIDCPTPEMIDDAVNEIMSNHSGTLNILLPKEDVLFVFEWDCLHISVFNPTEEMKPLMERIASSEGLFWWKGIA